MRTLSLALLFVLAAILLVAPAPSAASGCTTPACQILEGVFKALGISTQADECFTDLTATYKDMQDAATLFSQGKDQQAVWTLAESFAEFADASVACELTQVTQMIATLAQKMAHVDLQFLENDAVLLVNGLNVYKTVYEFAMDFAAQNYGNAGADLGELVAEIAASTPCANGACDVIEGALKILGVVVGDLGACRSDLGIAWSTLQASISAFDSKNYATAVKDLAQSLDQFAQATAPCNLQQLASLIQNEAQLLGAANVTWIGSSVSIMVHGLDVYADLFSAVQSFEKGDFIAFGAAITDLLSELESTQCTSSDEACIVLEAMLKAMQIAAKDMAGQCRVDITNAVSQMQTAASQWRSGSYSAAVASVAAALDDVALGLTDCNLDAVAKLVETEAAKLHIAVVKNLDQIVQVIVNGADIGNDVYVLVTDIHNGAWTKVGADLAALVSALGVSGCGNSKECQIVSGLLQSLEIITADLSGQCAQGIESGFSLVETGVQEFGNKQYAQALSDISKGLDAVAVALGQGCQLDALAKLIQAEAELIAGAQIKQLTTDVQIIINSANVFDDIYKMVTALESGNMPQLGSAVGDLLLRLRALSCTSAMCTLLDGVLQTLSIVAQDWGKCSADLDLAEVKFSTAFSELHNDQYTAALGSLADGFEALSTGVTDCDVKDLGAILQSEAQALHLGNVKVIGEAVYLLTNGANVYNLLYLAGTAFKGGDFRTAGLDLGKVLLDIASAQSKTGCSSPFCLIVQGAMDALNVETSLKQCGSDLSNAWTDLENAAEALFGDDVSLKTAVKDLAAGLDQVAIGVTDCHVQQVADIIAEVVTKLGGGGYIAWLEEVVKIVVEGSEVYEDIYGMATAFESRNWVMFGFEVVELAKVLA